MINKDKMNKIIKDDKNMKYFEGYIHLDNIKM